MKEGTLRVSKKLGGKIKSEGKEYSVPKEFTFSDRESFDKKDCKFEFEEDDKGNKRIVKIIVEDKEIPRSAAVIEGKASAKLRKEEAVKAEQERIEAERKAQHEKRQNAQTGQVQVLDTFSISDTCLPYDVSSSGIRDVDNFYLKFHKYARYGNFDRTKGQKDFRFFFEKSEGKNKTTHRIQFDFTEQKTLIEQACKDQHQSAARFHGDGNLATAEFKVDWRLVVGLGGASVYETSMTLHHLYGFPYIPASGVKGMVQAYIRSSHVKDYPEKQNDLKEIFGTQNHAGNIIFYDALPKNPPKIKPDVMNPHYTPYYKPGNKTEPPADYHKPIPVNFLTVVDTSFCFVIGVSQRVEDAKKKALLEKVRKWLNEALEEQGIGAKTAVGYGYFSKA